MDTCNASHFGNYYGRFTTSPAIQVPRLLSRVQRVPNSEEARFSKQSLEECDQCSCPSYAAEVL